MSQVKLRKDLAGNKAEQTITIASEQAAQRLVKRGIAEPVEAPAVKVTKTTKKKADQDLTNGKGGGASPAEEPTTAG